MGKYDNVIKGLPKLPWASGSSHGGIEYWEKVDITKAEFKGDYTDLTKTYFEMRKEQKTAEEALKAVNLKITALVQRIEELYEAKGIKSLKLVGGTLRLDPAPYAVVEDPAAFHQWCLDNGREAEMNLLWQTTNSLLKERMLDGEPNPPGLKAFVKTSPVYIKPK